MRHKSKIHPEDIDPKDVPSSLRHLIGLVIKWAFVDVDELEVAMADCSRDEAEELINAFDDYSEEIDGWLSGDESYSPDMSNAYLAFSYARIAAFQIESLL